MGEGVRKLEGFRDKNTKKGIEILVNKLLEEGLLREKLLKQKEERKKQKEEARARANVDDRSSLAVLDTPILTKILKQFAYISTTQSQKCEKSKSEEPHLTQAASGQNVSPIIIDAKLTEQIEVPTDAPGGTRPIISGSLRLMIPRCMTIPLAVKHVSSTSRWTMPMRVTSRLSLM